METSAKARGYKKSRVRLSALAGGSACPEGIVPDPDLDAAVARPALDHSIGLAGERAGPAGRRLEIKGRPVMEAQ